jgi:hypothetical protein
MSQGTIQEAESVNVGDAWKPEIVETREASLAIATPLSLLQLAIEKNLDAERIQQYMDLQDRMEKKRALQEYTAGMVNCQKRAAIVVKDKKNESTGSWFARLETVAKEIKPIYTDEGFILEFSEADSPLENHRRIICDVTHEGGHCKQFHLDSKIDDVGAKGAANKTAVQGLGSMVSYLRRYLTLMIFNIVVADEDNDGQSNDALLTEEQCAYLRSKLEECEKLGRAINQNRLIAWIAEEQKDKERVQVFEDVQQRFYAKAKKALEAEVEKAIKKRSEP